MKKILSVMATAIKIVALSSFAGYVVYIFCLDKFLKGDEEDTSNYDTEFDNKNFDKDSGVVKKSSYGEFDPLDYPPYEDTENPAPGENTSEEFITRCNEFFRDM